MLVTLAANRGRAMERPDLRIIPEPLWNAVQKRLKAVKQNYIREQSGTLWGRPETGRVSSYLLSGLARCGLASRRRYWIGK
jgi:hypothetical protein